MNCDSFFNISINKKCDEIAQVEALLTEEVNYTRLRLPAFYLKQRANFPYTK